MNFRKFAPAFLITLLLFPVSAFSQWFDEIQTESDWEDGYNNGYYDYNTYQLYRELGEGATIDDTTDFFANALGNPLSEIEPGWLLTDSTETDSITYYQVPRAILREGQKVLENDNNGYTLISGMTNNISILYKGRNESNSWNTERRFIALNKANLQITLGNYSPNIGMGLGIGRFDYRPLSFQSTATGREDFILPDNSYYNGFDINYRNRISLMYSRKQYNNSDKDFVASSISYDVNDIKLGATASTAISSSHSGHRTMGAGSIFLSNHDIGLKAEMGYAESGMGLCLQYRRSRSDIRLWHYDKSFLNLQSSAPAHSDHISYFDENLNLSFRQPQAGESGAYLARRITISNLGMYLSSEIWKRSPVDAVAMDNSILASYLINRYVNVFSKYSNRFGPFDKRTLFEGGINFHSRYEIDILTSIWLENGHIINSKSLNHIYCSLPVYDNIIVAGRLRWKLNGNFDYFIEEKTMIRRNVSIKLTYRWRDTYHDKIGPFYLLLESSL